MFDQYNLRKDLENGLKEIGFKKPTPIQEKVLPIAIRKKNVIGVSRTGSGKTHAFLIPILQNIKINYNAVQSVIIAPTRELATQIHKMSVELIKASEMKIKSSIYVGGQDIDRQAAGLEDFQPHIVVATPSRLIELYKMGALNYTTADSLVIDEADMVLDMGFFDIVDVLVGNLRETCQKMVFSATITEQLSHHVSKYLKNTEVIRMDDLWVHPNIKHYLVPVRGASKMSLIDALVKELNPYMCFIFANKKSEVDEIQTYLTNNGVDAGILHGGLKPRERRNALKTIQSMRYKFVVCSDIAARGMDIDGVSHIIHWNLPLTDDWYMHRSGRAGRGTYDGTSIVLYQDDDQKIVDRLRRKGIHFVVKRFRNGEWSEKELERKPRKQRQTAMDKEISELFKNRRQAKGIKPGYKKKLSRNVQKIKKKYKRAAIEEQVKAHLELKWKKESKQKRLDAEGQ